MPVRPLYGREAFCAAILPLFTPLLCMCMCVFTEVFFQPWVMCSGRAVLLTSSGRDGKQGYYKICIAYIKFSLDLSTSRYTSNSLPPRYSSISL